MKYTAKKNVYIFLKSLIASLFLAVIILSPLFYTGEASADITVSQIPYQDKIIKILVEIENSDLKTTLIFRPAGGSLSAVLGKADATDRKIKLTKNQMGELADLVGGIDVSGDLELTSPAGDKNLIKSGGTTHLFGNRISKLLDENCSPALFSQITAKLTREIIKSFTKNIFLFIANTETDISYKDYYDNKEKLKNCCNNLSF